MSLLDLQNADSRADHAELKARSLPQLAQIAALEAELAELDGQRIEAETVVADLLATQRKADGEVETVKARRERDTQRLNSGQITNPKDLESLQHEIGALNRRIDTLELEELEVMQSVEDAQKETDRIHSVIAEKQSQKSALESERDAALAELNAVITEAKTEREAHAAQIDGQLLALYEKLRNQYSGVGAAALRGGTCEGCRLQINAADLREIEAKPADAVIRCPECSRILVRV